ncbi:MAG: glycosyl hydrolase, partial [Cyclobacteriaceae bacterium]|nr:glycosyl hydrolase [Cyclobacteriaceae bacterium]
HFTRVVRADPDKQGLLYCGTESGMYISFDDGASWKPFQLNLPIVPITDLTIKNKNLIAATQGRSFWMIDDLTPLHQLNEEIAKSQFYLYKPLDSYQMSGGSAKNSRTAGLNHPGGVMVHFFIKELTDSTTIDLEFLEEDGSLIKKFSNHAKEKKDSLAVEKGTNLFVWNMRYEDAKKFDGMILWWANISGPKAIPGSYQVKLKVDNDSITRDIKILKDPRIQSSQEELKYQFDFLLEIRDKLTEAHQAIIDIRKVKTQLSELKEKLDAERHARLLETIETILEKINGVEENLYQTKNKSNQDPLNYPIKLTNKLGHLAALNSYGNFRPTKQESELKDELFKKIDGEI